MLCIIEQPKGGKGTDEKVEIGIVSVDPQTGATIYDNFEDGHMRSELEVRALSRTQGLNEQTRILHLRPTEIVSAQELSKQTQKLCVVRAVLDTSASCDRRAGQALCR